MTGKQILLIGAISLGVVIIYNYMEKKANEKKTDAASTTLGDSLPVPPAPPKPQTMF
jgi:hypothetical protein